MAKKLHQNKWREEGTKAYNNQQRRKRMYKRNIGIFAARHR